MSRRIWRDTVAACGLNHVVITSVDRDDLRDGGAAHFAACIRAVRERVARHADRGADARLPRPLEVALDMLAAAPPDVMNHNLETVPRLYREARPGADYAIRCELLRAFKARPPEVLTKSGLMLGLGETDDEVIDVMRDLRDHDVDMLTVGQYLQPRARQPAGAPLRDAGAVRALARAARVTMGFAHAACGPLVRSSYHADRQALAAGAAQPRDSAPVTGFRRRIQMADPHHKPFYKSLYFQVITAIVIGVLLGHFYPETGAAMKPLGDGFIKLIKMIIAPIIFCTVVVGIAGMEDMKKVGKTGGYALLYFEIVSTIALIVGLVIVNVVQPGVGMNIDPATLDTKGIAAYTRAGQDAEHHRVPAHVIPSTVVDAFAKGEILQVLLFSVLFGFALHQFGGRGTLVFDFIEKIVARAVRDRRLHHEGGARSARSARWRSRSASTASAR